MNKVTLVILALLLGLIFSTISIHFGWELFVVPVFGLKSLTFQQNFGLSLLISLFRSGNNWEKYE